jgi:LysM repeat protein
MPRPRGRRRPPRTWESYAAPIAFLVAATVALLLVRSALRHDSSQPVATTRPPVTTRATASQPTTTSRRKPGAKARYYVVQAGDTFGTIAAKSGVSVAQIEQLNPNVASTSLHIGQKIRVG